jgi:hypothetical protein
MAATLWDKRAKYSVADFTFSVCSARRSRLHQVNPQPDRLQWSITIFLAAYSLLIALLWRYRETVIEYAGRLGIPRRVMPGRAELPG